MVRLHGKGSGQAHRADPHQRGRPHDGVLDALRLPALVGGFRIARDVTLKRRLILARVMEEPSHPRLVLPAWRREGFRHFGHGVQMLLQQLPFP